MIKLRIGHSPDADDAFMFYALTHGLVQIEGPEPIAHEEVLEDIQSLNRMAMLGSLEMTAISAAVYPEVSDRYRILACGASMGLNYGPIVVANRRLAPAELEGKRVAIPGRQTTAFLLARLYLPPFEAVVMPFDRVMEPVAAGELDAALVIHEGQLTYVDAGLTKILDLGEAWHADTGLPLPLGLDVVRRDLGDEWHAALGKALSRSIDYALKHSRPSLEYALKFGRGIDAERGEKFARMYVNEYTVDMGEQGREALAALYGRALQRGLLASLPPLDIAGL